MPAPSKIERLPDTLRAELDRRIAAGAFAGYEGLSGWLAEQGFEISRSAVQRYGQALERRMAAIRASTEAAKSIAAAAPDDADDRSNAIMALVQSEMFEALMAVQDAQDLEPAERVELYSRAAKNIATLSRASVNRARWVAEMRRQDAAKLAAAVDAGEIDAEAAERARRILGFA